MIIRRIGPRDLTGLLGLYRQLHPDDPPPDEAGIERVWDRLLSDPGVRVFVAEVGESLVSTCTLVVIPNLTRGGRPYGLVENVVTAKDHRRRGYAGALLRRALDDAWREGCYKVMLLTGSKRPETLRFYEAAGFRSGLKTGFVAYPPSLEARSGSGAARDEGNG